MTGGASRAREGLALLVLLITLAGCSKAATPGGDATRGAGSPSAPASSALPPAPSPTPPPPVPSPSASASSLAALRGVDWAQAVVGLLSCGPLPLPSPGARVGQVSYVQPDAGHALAIVLASCNASAGDPPDGLFAFDGATSATSAHLLQTLLSPALDRLGTAFSAAGPTVAMTEAAYSSGNVPDCCPNLTEPVTWTWNGSSYRGSPPADATGPPLTATVSPATSAAAAGSQVSFSLAVTDAETVPVTGVSVFVISSSGSSPCSNAADCPDSGLTWVSGSPGCTLDPETGTATCALGTLAPGASKTVTVMMKVVLATGTLTFSPEIDGTLAAGRLLPVLPQATVTVSG